MESAMPTKYRDPKFPVTIPTDVRVSDIDLDTEPFRAGGQPLTEARAGRVADELASRSTERSGNRWPKTSWQS